MRTLKALLLAACICGTTFAAIPESVTSSYAASIVASVTEITVFKDTIAVGESVQLELKWSNGKQQDVSFSSSDESIASVDESGIVTGISDGTVTITLKHSEAGRDKTIDITVSSDVEKSAVYNTSELALGTKLRKYDKLHYDNKNIGGCANIVNTKGSYDLAFINNEDYVLPFDAELVGIEGLYIYIAPEIEGLTYIDGRTLEKGAVINRNTHLLCYDYYIKSAAKSTKYKYPVFLPEYYGKYIGDGEIHVSAIDHENKVIELESVPTIKGDVNGDGEFNISDAVTLQKWLLSIPDTTLVNWNSADMCSDGVLDIFDLCAMKKELLSAPVSQSDKSIIAGLKNGMTRDEVFAVIGKNYTSEEEKTTQKHTYNYPVKAGTVFGTDLNGEMFVEFDLKTGLLVNYGYALGRLGTMDNREYPYSEQQLKEAYDKIYAVMTDWYGEGTKGSLVSTKAEYTWMTEYGNVWAVYGVNLWNYSATPESYEKGINEIVLSCSVEGK